MEVRLLVAALVMFATPALASIHKPVKKRLPPVELTALNTHEIFVLQPALSGTFGKAQLRGWNRFLRCHHTGRVHQMATRLASLIYETSKHFDFAKVLVVAGYRAPKIAREKGNPKSPHKRGLACDFRVEGVSNTELRDYLRGAFARVGVGYYPNSDFVHLDVRQKNSAFWIDYSGPGERARYSRSPDEDLRTEKYEELDEAASAIDSALGLNPANSPVETKDKAEGAAPQVAPSPGAPAPHFAGETTLTH
jgi:uncharacterized protein YcbK (DUF882 family)